MRYVLALIAALCLFSAKALAGYATPINIATNDNSAVPASGTLAVTVPAGGVPAHSLIIVETSLSGTANGTHTFTGSELNDGANTYLVADQANPNANTANGVTVLFFAFNAVALAQGATIAITNQDSGGARQVVISAAYSTGGPTTNPLNAAASTSGGATGSSTTPSGAMRAVPVANSLGIGLMDCHSASGVPTITQDSGNGWASPPNNPVGHQFADQGGGSKITSTQDTYAPTLSTSQDWAVVIGVFTPTSCTGTLLLLGAGC